MSFSIVLFHSTSIMYSDIEGNEIVAFNVC